MKSEAGDDDANVAAFVCFVVRICGIVAYLQTPSRAVC